MKRSSIIFMIIAFLLGVTIIIAAMLVGLGSSKSSSIQPASIEKLNLKFPQGYSISSYASYGDTLVLCCYNDSLDDQGLPTVTLLTYKYGDASFSTHPTNIIPYEQLRTSLQVINDKLYLFYTIVEGGTYVSYLEEVNTNNWALSDQKQLNLPNLLAPGVEASDGKDLYIVGGRTINTNPPYWPSQANDTILKVDVNTGETRTVAILPGASGMRGLFLGNDLVMVHRSGDFNGGPETNYGSVDWNTTILYSLGNGTVSTPSGLDALSSSGPLPASDGSALYFFNPDELNSTLGIWNYTHEVWKMSLDGTLNKVNITLPDDLQYVIPIRLGNGFFLINFSMAGTTLWWCTLAT